MYKYKHDASDFLKSIRQYLNFEKNVGRRILKSYSKILKSCGEENKHFVF